MAYRMPAIKPIYAVFEGGDGAGKSTQARILAEKIGATLTFEPGSTETGARLREILLSPDLPDLDPTTEALLMAADRHQLMSEVIEPSLAKGKSVVSDRSFVSSLAYQGAARELGLETILDINLKLQKVRVPDILFILEPPPLEELKIRMGQKKLDRIESLTDGFQARVSEAFGQMAHTLARDSRTMGIHICEIPTTVSGSVLPVDAVTERIDQALSSFLGSSNITLPSVQ